MNDKSQGTQQAEEIDPENHLRIRYKSAAAQPPLFRIIPVEMELTSTLDNRKDALFPSSESAESMSDFGSVGRASDCNRRLEENNHLGVPCSNQGSRMA